MEQMAFCDLSHTFHKQITYVSELYFVILLWGILHLPLRNAHVAVLKGHNTQHSDHTDKKNSK